MAARLNQGLETVSAMSVRTAHGEQVPRTFARGFAPKDGVLASRAKADEDRRYHGLSLGDVEGVQPIEGAPQSRWRTRAASSRRRVAANPMLGDART